MSSTPSVDKYNPAGFSAIWIQEYLRKKGFDAVVMSDCLSMEGAKVASNTAINKLIAAQKAGCDFLMLTHQHNAVDPEKPQKLNDLLAIIDKVPDNIESAKRRAKFAEPIFAKNTVDNKTRVEILQQATRVIKEAGTLSVSSLPQISDTPTLTYMHENQKAVKTEVAQVDDNTNTPKQLSLT